MRKYLIRRFLNMIPTLILVSLIVFSILRLLPSDPVRILAGMDRERGDRSRPLCQDESELWARSAIKSCSMPAGWEG